MKIREVTRKDVADAAMIAQLMGGADIVRADFSCVEQPSRKLHDCPDCKHIEYGAMCEHRGGEWECVASAIGASPQAFDLWMEISNAFSTPVKEREAEPIDMRLYAWVDSIREGGLDRNSLGLNGLEVAAILRDGHLPPGWRLVAKRSATARFSCSACGKTYRTWAARCSNCLSLKGLTVHTGAMK